ncbi:alpha/beta fold hydrolase [Acidaminobacter hydrogenoformans]|uniref:Lysophospholipase, alpha-beta hydrolase superfamily n=1 Tax=Acidaminobacter hydrogenoformans DSM 2784 TaxID=1120920 RepID=A0A1G5S1V4_9FIRM|nr:alpha/beta hydrolase [Acidaminobacter hydrogenoformans]SCZ80293.1 Lysophospholipase, alpha-beta hydrolase superfamily [Acidaminobacter hydrogenoformans DSM 2784]
MKPIQLTASDGLELSVVIFESKSNEPEALVQILHGAQEHKGRYFELARFLQGHGYTVVLSDIRGHGESISAQVPKGCMGSLEQILEDQKLIADTLKKLYPGKPLYLFGHSMGSLFARCYLQAHDDDIEKLILSGTVDYRFYARAGVLIAKLISTLKGDRGHSQFLNALLGINGKDDSWVSANPANRIQRKNDPHFFTSYENAAILAIATANLQQRAFDKFLCKNPDLEILSITGEEDPITGGRRGLQGSMDALRKAGYTSVESKVYKRLRHEVIHEVENQQVFEDLLKFLTSQTDQDLSYATGAIR